MRTQKIYLFLGGLFLPFLISACVEEVPSNELGPATSPEAIVRAQVKSLTKLNALNTKQGQTAHIAETQEITTSEGPIYGLLKEWTTNVILREDNEEQAELTTLRRVLNHNIEGKPIYDFKHVFTIDKNNISNNKAFEPKTLAEKLAQKKFEEINSQNNEIEITDVSFHNLKSEAVTLVPPERVLKSPNCRGLSPCQIKADRILYDIVFHFSDESTRSHQIEWLISSEVPFFSSILKQCATTLVPVDDLRVLVKQCQEVVDFSF